MKPLMTRRRAEIIEMLENRTLSVKEIADEFLIESPEIVEDLKHIAELVKPHHKLKFTPAVCRSCGFEFKDRKTGKPPSTCPKCKSHGFEVSRYFIE